MARDCGQDRAEDDRDDVRMFRIRSRRCPAIGPSVCKDCYEVSGDVIEKFKGAFDEKLWPELFYEKENGKYQLDLWKANEFIFLESGILPEHMAVTNLCTHCNSRILYSHRAMGDRRGNLCAFLALKQ